MFRLFVGGNHLRPECFVNIKIKTQTTTFKKLDTLTVSVEVNHLTNLKDEPVYS